MLGLQEELPFDQFKRYRALRLTQNPFHIFSEFLLPFWLATAHNSQIPSTSFSYHATLDSISRSMQVIVLALGLFPTNNQLRT